MAPVVPDPARVRSFASAAAFEAWLRKHHDRAPELWLKIHKKSSGRASVSHAEALDVALCWGWIDGLRKGFDERSFLQRFTPRRAKSIWSQVNRDHVARLIAAGRMAPPGQRQIDAAMADGRWQAAYAPIRATTTASLPADLAAAIEAEPQAGRTLARLSRMELFSLLFRLRGVKTAPARARTIAGFVAMLARGETLVPGTSATRPVERARPSRR